MLFVLLIRILGGVALDVLLESQTELAEMISALATRPQLLIFQKPNSTLHLMKPIPFSLPLHFLTNLHSYK